MKRLLILFFAISAIWNVIGQGCNNCTKTVPSYNRTLPNLVTNPSFETPMTNVPGTTILSRETLASPPNGSSAAASWGTYTNSVGAVITSLEKTTCPMSANPGSYMLHSLTSGVGNGVVNAFLPFHGGNALTASASVWIRVVRGSVCIGLTDGGLGAGSVTVNANPNWQEIKFCSWWPKDAACKTVTEIWFYGAEECAEFYVDAVHVAKD